MLRRRATLNAWQRTTSPTDCSTPEPGWTRCAEQSRARAPWPASENFGAEPESSWYPPELLAHVAEMVPYWMAQIERILEGYPEPVPFGRVQTDEERIAAIGRDRALPVGDLFDRIATRTDAAAGRLGELSAEQLERRGTHPTRGEMTVGAVVERMLINHIGEHVEQLESILGSPPERG